MRPRAFTIYRHTSSLCAGFSRGYSTKRPHFQDVFPNKKLVNRLLFEMDSKLTFSRLYPVYEAVYNSLEAPEVPGKCIPSSFKGEDVLMMKKVLEKLRHRTKTLNRNLVALESELLEKAAELGDNDAIAALAFQVLEKAEKNTPEDVTHAKKLIKTLYKMPHPLTIKLTADLAFTKNDFVSAEKFYRKYLELENDTYRAGEVSGKLGIINFKKPDLKAAEEYFLRSIRICPLEQVVQSYYYLAQLYMDSEPLKARCLMESAASEGFKESFQSLGFLEMNYFQNYAKALEWFKLGMELFDFQCFIGYFDCSIKLESYQKAKKCLESMQTISKNNEMTQKSFDLFLSSRAKQIQALESRTTNVVTATNLYIQSDDLKSNSPPEKNDRWGL
ncbi:LAFA_0G09010g1_1 [Lachancea sp. 'fantastica']|nr:LAFA_0G09010g1_1 [Lachancea sp. 'fantastica']